MQRGVLRGEHIGNVGLLNEKICTARQAQSCRSQASAAWDFCAQPSAGLHGAERSSRSALYGEAPGSGRHEMRIGSCSGRNVLGAKGIGRRGASRYAGPGRGRDQSFIPGARSAAVPSQESAGAIAAQSRGEKLLVR